jgi:hypothetical protein
MTGMWCLCGHVQHPGGPCPRKACGCRVNRPERVSFRRDHVTDLAGQDLDSPELTVAFLAEQLTQARRDADQATGELGTLRQELAAANAENELLAACQAFALWVSDLGRASRMPLRRRITLDDLIRRANVALTGGES